MSKQPMTLSEIAKELGCSTEAVRLTYIRAIRKLRNRPETLKKLRELAAEKERVRHGVTSL